MNINYLKSFVNFKFSKKIILSAFLFAILCIGTYRVYAGTPKKPVQKPVFQSEPVVRKKDGTLVAFMRQW